MVDLDLLSAKLAELSDRIARIKSHRGGDAGVLRRNRDALDLVSFNLMLAVQICADISSHLIADEGWVAAKTLAEGFTRAREHQVIDEPTAEALCRAVGLRNVVAHGYAGIDVELVHRAATDGMQDLERFAKQVARWARDRAAGSL
ncbi:MAG: DUF86 domain-containing protein [Proteobacteria bacterium]|nr:DUF86 domain-containing protein [Pseudomonadota bacterium]